MDCDRIWRNAHLATLAGEGLGVVADGIVAARDGRIVFAGPAAKAPGFAGGEVIDCGGRWITPGLIDCHTHLVYAGDRAEEFERRLNGESYEAIARGGGGILTTVKATRAASVEALAAAALPRLDALLAEGVTTVEIKNGYGLSLEAELKQLAAARALAARRQVRVITTLLAAHTAPPEFRADPDRYIDLICGEILPAAAAAGVDQVDAFCETIAFSPGQVRRVFEAARRLRLPVKLHADQLSNGGGAALAAEFGALSADHLEHLDAAGAEALARAGVTAVLLPGAYYFTREERRPPVDLLRAHGVPMAVATDCNPGTSPLTSLLLALNMAATFFRLTVSECLAGVTRNAARALGLADAGVLVPGARCDLAIWDIERPAELVYRIGFNPLHARVFEGVMSEGAMQDG